MNILFVCENYYPHLGGAEVLFKNLAEQFVERGHSAMVLTHLLPGTEKQQILSGVQIHRVPSFFSRYVFTFSSLWKASREARTKDVLQTTTFNGAFPAWCAAKLWGKPVVLTVHEVWGKKWQEITGFPWWKSKLHQFLEKMIYLLPFDQYICVSEATRQDLLRQHISPEKIAVVHNGLDYLHFDPRKVSQKEILALREKIGLASGHHVFLSWGRPGPSKGFECLLQAFSLFLQKISEKAPARQSAELLLMFGSKEKYASKYRQLLALVHHLGLQEKVKILDSLPYQHLPVLIAVADSIIVPSVSEGFGYAAVEAMAMGKPLVVSDAGSLPEVVGGKHLIFQKKNAPDLAEKMEKAIFGKWIQGKEKKFPWEKCVDGYLETYKIVLQRRAMQKSEVEGL